jgi:tetratricopeptide (TPR) repeat protein
MFNFRDNSVTERMRRILAQLDDQAILRARVQAVLANRMTHDIADWEEERIDLMKEALAQIPAISDDLARGEILLHAQFTLPDYAEVEQLLDYCRQAYELGVRARSVHLQADALSSEVVHLLRLGRPADLELAIRAIGRQRDFADRTGAPTARYSQATLDAMLALACGKFDAAEQAVQDAADHGRPWGGAPIAESVMAQLGWCHYERGRTAELAEMLDDIMVADVFPGNELGWRLARGLIHAECDEPDQALSIMRTTATETDSFRGLLRGPIRISVLALAALVIAHPTVLSGLSPEDGRRWGFPLAKLLDRHQTRGVLLGWPQVFLGDKARFIGLAHMAAGDSEKAVEMLKRAADVNSPFASLRARTLFDLARAHIRAGRPHEAHTLLSSGRVMSEKLGMRNLVAQIDQVLAVLNSNFVGRREQDLH